MNEVYVMLNLVAILVTALYWYMVLTRKDPIYRIAVCTISVVVWYATAGAAIRVNDLGNVVSLLYDLFALFQIISGFRETLDLWREGRLDFWGGRNG